jgi:hypothetical protein
MMYRIPFADPSPDRDDHCGEPKLPEPLAIIRKATFQWPPECVAVHRSRIGHRYIVRPTSHFRLRCRCLLHDAHVALHRLRQLRIYFIRYRHNIGQE